MLLIEYMIYLKCFLYYSRIFCKLTTNINMVVKSVFRLAMKQLKPYGLEIVPSLPCLYLYTYLCLYLCLCLYHQFCLCLYLYIFIFISLPLYLWSEMKQIFEDHWNTSFSNMPQFLGQYHFVTFCQAVTNVGQSVTNVGQSVTNVGQSPWSWFLKPECLAMFRKSIF